MRTRSRRRSRADHPRSRGVYSACTRCGRASSGSSPLARGLQGHADYWLGRFRIIPARAGFTEECGPRRPAGWDHPRSRGVYVDDFDLIVEHEGSSPLARGLRLGNPRPRTSPGIIPARAGFTRRRGRLRRRGWDHPRSRGVYDVSNMIVDPDNGSSPLARGLQPPRGEEVSGDGIIPARAGFTMKLLVMGVPFRDHPRSRGVYPAWSGFAPSAWGSSPLARGLPWARRGGGAGHMDHPRSRGVYAGIRSAHWRAAGSSPLARGLHARLRVPGRRRRIIPARAGFTDGRGADHLGAGDHPRSRGVYIRDAPDRASDGGSSPLARGLPSLSLPQVVSLGIIPARAGFTASCGTSTSTRWDHPRSRGVYATG